MSQTSTPFNSVPTLVGNTAQQNEFEDLLLVRSTTYCDLLVFGDINIHVDYISKSSTQQLYTSLDIFGPNLLVKSATHIGGHILDIVATSNANM